MYTNKTSLKTYTLPRFFFYLGLLFIGQTVFRPTLSITLSDWFFLISFCLATSESLLRRKLEIRFPPYMLLGLFLFTIGGFISSFFSVMPLMSIISLLKYLYLIAVWFWLGTILLQTPNQIYTATTLWISSAALSGLGALIQLIWNNMALGYSHAWSRMKGFTEHVNDLGGLTSIALIPSIMILTQYSKPSFRSIYFWTCTGFIVVGLVLSVSMSGVFALIASLSVWTIFSKYSHRRVFIISIACVMLLTAIIVQNHYETVSILSRFYDISDDGLYSLTLRTRVETYAAAWEVISKNPIFGVGLGPEVGSTKTGYVVHNIFLMNWFESGLFGLLGMLIILNAIALQGYKGLIDPIRYRERIIGSALFSSYIAFLVLGMAQPIYYKRFGWISASLLLALYSSQSNLSYKKKWR